MPQHACVRLTLAAEKATFKPDPHQFRGLTHDVPTGRRHGPRLVAIGAAGMGGEPDFSAALRSASIRARHRLMFSSRERLASKIEWAFCWLGVNGFGLPRRRFG